MDAVVNQRRFEDLPKGDPEDVVPLAFDHPAITEMRTLFPSTVVDAKDSPNLLVSGHNNRKIGKMVTKGAWAGMPIYTLTLEERATCPSTCFMLKACYGNGMHMARRNRHGDDFETYLAAELFDLSEEHPFGFVVRLHVLGDFYSKAYVELWEEWLSGYTNLHVYGYTARSISDGDLESREIAKAVHHVNTKFQDRCFIRFSNARPQMFGATVITRIPESNIVPEGYVCPAETSDTDCCATCGLCWSPAMRDKTIVFVQHGKGATETKAEIRLVSKKDPDGMRPVRAYKTGLKQWDALKGKIIEIRHVAPTDLWIDERYQRNLSRKSADLITKMAKSWDWRKFNLPTVVEAEDGRLHVIDGQHTAMAAASRHDIEKLPVKLVDAESLQDRAETFVGINRDRVQVTLGQIFFAELAAQIPEAVGVKAMCDAADVIVLRQPPPRNDYGPGETMAIGTLRRIYRMCGAQLGTKILNILVEAGFAPLNDWAITAVTMLMTEPRFEPRLDDGVLWTYLRPRVKTLLAKAYQRHANTSERLPTCAAEIIWAECK